MANTFPAEHYKNHTTGSEELVNALVADHIGWAEAIARSVARSWNLDWQLDGLDGGAFEALLFCAKRYDPGLGVPFRAYARKRIHEASTEEARKSKAWQRAVGSGGADQDAREISYRLFEIFPELRDGALPGAQSGEEEDVRSAIRQLLSSASVVATFQENGALNPESAMDYKQMLEHLADMEPVHQLIVWSVYWCGQSMRSVAEEWGTDELTVIREHREILSYIHSRINSPRGKVAKKLKIRPSLRAVALQMRKKKFESPFGRFASAAPLILFALAVRLYGHILN